MKKTSFSQVEEKISKAKIIKIIICLRFNDFSFDALGIHCAGFESIFHVIWQFDYIDNYVDRIIDLNWEHNEFAWEIHHAISLIYFSISFWCIFLPEKSQWFHFHSILIVCGILTLSPTKRDLIHSFSLLVSNETESMQRLRQKLRTANQSCSTPCKAGSLHEKKYLHEATMKIKTKQNNNQ